MARNGIIALVLLLLWDSVLVRPLRVLVVFFHEIAHALSALVSGGGVFKIEIISFETGHTDLYPGFPLLVYSAGYLGTAFLGSLLLASGARLSLKRWLYLPLGLTLLTSTLFLVDNPFGRAYGLLAGSLFLLLFFKDLGIAAYLTDLLGILCLMDTLQDLSGFLIHKSRNDAAILEELTGMPYGFIVPAWLGLTLLLAAAAIYCVLKYATPENLRYYAAWSRIPWIRGKTGGCADEGPAKRDRRTILVYLSILAILVLVALYASRYVIFQPWTARDWLAAARVGDRFYVAGGRDRAGLIYDTVHQIEPGRLKIRPIARLPAPRFGMEAAAWEGKVYLLGGFDGRKVSDEVLVLDPRTRKLRPFTRLPGPRAFGTAAAAAEKLFYSGGWDGAKLADELLAVDPQTGAVEVVGRLPSPREHAALSAVPGSKLLYLFGGSGDGGEYLDEILELHQDSGQVVRVGRLPDPWIRGAAVAAEDEFFLLGGWEGKKRDLLWVMDPSAPVLEAKSIGHLPRGSSDAAALWLDGAVYLIGGQHERFSRQLRVLRIDPQDLTAKSLKFRTFLFW